MKFISTVLMAGLTLLFAVPVTQAEDLEAFLKRAGTGKAATNEVHEHFHGMVFVDNQVHEIDREQLFKTWEGQRAAKTELVVDKLTIIAKTETPDKDIKGAVISVVAQVSVTEKVAGSTLQIESIGHYIILRGRDGDFHLLYLAVPKQVRKV